MTDRAEIERLLQMTGRTLEELPKSYSIGSIVTTGRSRGVTPYELGETILHQSDVIELLVGALRDALGISTIEINDAQFEEFSKKAREIMRKK